MKKKEDITFGVIIPLIGGLALGTGKALDKMPEFVLSWAAFQNNDQHYINYLRTHGWEGDYILLDEDLSTVKNIIPDAKSIKDCSLKHVDIMCGLPPCAGLSSFASGASMEYSKNAKVNDWMIMSSKYVLETIKPDVWFFENAVYLATNKGKFLADQLYDMADDNGYSLLLYCTESHFHDNPQTRPRSYAMCTKKDTFGDWTMKFKDKPHRMKSFEDLIKEVHSLDTELDECITSTEKPSDNPYYKLCYELVHATSYRDLVEKICTRTHSENLIKKAIELMDNDHLKMADWMEKHGFDKVARVCRHRQDKVNENKGYWTHGITMSRFGIPAFIGAQPFFLCHPFEDRYVTFREGLAIMDFPEDYTFAENTNLRRYANHLCQNVCQNVAFDIADGVIEWMTGENTENYENATYVVQNNRNHSYQVRKSTEASLDKFI